MSDRMTRRSVLWAAGAGGVGLSGAGVAVGVAGAYRGGLLGASLLARLPRVPEGVRATDRAALGRDDILKVPARPALASRLVEVHHSPGEGLEGLGVDVRQHAAEFVCDPRCPNLLLEGARRVSYEIVEVAWQPGEGWPVYRSRAPHQDHAIGLRYAGVPRHQVVLLDDRAIYVGNPGAIGVLDDIRGPLRVDVNGASHEEHRGFYKVLITGIA